MSYRWKLLTALIVLLSIFICVMIYIHKPIIQQTKQPLIKKIAIVSTLKQGTYPISSILYGVVVTPQNYQINSHLNTDVKTVFVKEGDYVYENQPLIELDEKGIKKQIEILNNQKENNSLNINQKSKELKTRLSILKAFKERKEAQEKIYQRNQVLHEKKIISTELWNDVEKQKQKIDSEYLQEQIQSHKIQIEIKKLNNENDSLQQDLDELERDLKDTFIKAPINGSISNITATEGHRIRPNLTLIEIIPNDSYEVHVVIPSMYQYSIDQFKTVTAQTQSYGGHSVQLQFDHFLPSSTANPYGRTAAFKLAPIESRYFHINQSIVMNVFFPPIQNAYAIPSDSIYYNQYIYLINQDNQLVLKKVTKSGSFIQDEKYFSVIQFDSNPQYLAYLVSKFPDAVDGMAIIPRQLDD
ncbi:MAG: hypothetical protein CMF42_04215 [Legionellales bacterium]|nr:hypothetical protein [Legionellales bacterium]OUX67549.1 MAG: hypothetical protein CBD38_02595 [bacterium TMED178]